MSKEMQNNRGLEDIKAAKLEFIRRFWVEGDAFVDEMIAIQGHGRVVEIQFPAILNAIKSGSSPERIRNYRSQDEIDGIIRRAQNLLDELS